LQAWKRASAELPTPEFEILGYDHELTELEPVLDPFTGMLVFVLALQAAVFLGTAKISVPLWS
jgi:hypothetical protein